MSTISASTLPSLPAPRPDHAFTRPPKSAIGLFFWRRRMWFESTFVLSMLEPWEKLMLLTMLGITLILVMTGLVKYLPQHLVIMQRRAVYYLWGQEGDERILWQWLGAGASASPGLYKEL
ncbi:hypothetical protein H0H81_007848 [Sphagnurus paluster]|uniref:Uncharacterized protein n=1 Tax=Sphagnurus paluster TaxID=117069 RepID=A0A9P7FUF6_9AGAR|nr:hypothetical protein H0H81_007848 [Sphagnurus paluster]